MARAAAWNAAAPEALAASTRSPAAVSRPIWFASRETRFSVPLTDPESMLPTTSRSIGLRPSAVRASVAADDASSSNGSGRRPNRV